ncbi:MAG: LuxR C-terminal-related transcriptional regulator [Candidatus Dormibacteria bacterium]
MLEGLPFVGRRLELERVAELLDAERSIAVLLRGPEGAGTSRLAREIASAARARGWTTCEVAATDAAQGIPFGVFAHLAPESERADTLTLLVRAPQWLPGADGTGRRLLIVDDANTLDDASWALVSRLVSGETASAVLCLGAGLPLPPTILKLLRARRAVHVDVTDLPPDALGDIIRAALDGPVDRGFLVHVTDMIGSNLVLLDSLLDDGLASQTLSCAGGGAWRWSGNEMVLGARLTPVVHDWIQRIPSRDRAVLEVISAAAPRIELEVLQHIADLAAIEMLDDHGDIVVTQDGRRTFVSVRLGVYREALTRLMPPLRGRSVRGRLAAAVDMVGARRAQDPLRTITWRLDAHEPVGAGDLAEAAGLALRVDSHKLAERLAQAAIARGGGVAAQMTLARALVGRQRPGDVEDLLKRVDWAGLDDAQRADLVILRATNLMRGLQRLDDADAVLGGAEPSIVTATHRVDVMAIRAYVLYLRGRFADALELTDRIVSRPAEASAAARARVMAIRGAVWAVCGRPEQALTAIETALALPREGRASVSPTAGEMLGPKWEALWYAGRIGEAESLAAERHAVALRTHDDRERGRALLQLGLCARARGRLRTSMRWLEEALELTRGRYPFRLAATLAALAQVAAQLGDAATARRCMAQADDAGKGVVAFDAARLGLSRAWARCAEGLMTDARADAEAAADAAARAGCTSLEVIALYDIARFGDARAVAARLEGLTEQVEGRLLQTMCSAGTALSSRDGPALDDVAAAFVSMDLQLLGFEAAAAASAAHRRGGYPGRARASERTARALLEQCEGARTPALELLVDGEAVTVREREVATLAAQGLPNRAIAARLGVSVRTVENLLHRAYSKLDVHARQELGAALNPVSGE